MSSFNLSRWIPIDLTGLTEIEVKKVESVLRRAERIKGNGVVFKRVNSRVLSCQKTSVGNTTKLMNSLINTDLLSPKVSGLFPARARRNIGNQTRNR